MSGDAGPAERHGFDRQLRLLAAAQFAATFAARQVLRSSCFALHYRRNDMPVARLGLVIPKKQARAAVLRNAVKRQAREAFRQNATTLPPVDIVLRLARPLERPKPDRAARAAWRTEILGLFEQLRRKGGA